MALYQFYDGAIELCYEKRGRRSGYWPSALMCEDAGLDPKKTIPRVSHVAGLVGAPFSAACWYGAGLAKKKYLELAGTCEYLDLSAEAVGELLRRAAGDTTARDRGTEGHRCVQGFIEDGMWKITKDFDGLDAMLDYWEDWWDEQEVEIHTTEKKIYSKEFNYAGTLDLDATINGLRTVVDWKFGAIRDSVKTQLAAYSHARTEEFGIHYDQRMVVSVTEDGVKTEIFKNQEADFKAFLNLLEYHGWAT